MNRDSIINEMLQQLPQPLWESWYIKEMIGTGSFSAVFRAEAVRMKRVDSAALKIEPIIPDERFADDEKRSLTFLERKRADIEEESTIMYKLRGCPNVVAYEDEAVKEFYRGGKLAGYIFLIRMELLQNVYELMKHRSFDMSEKNVIRLALDIGSGLKAAHDIGVIHRDIKPSNFFVSKNGTYKLGDFNISKQTDHTRSFAGTEGYIAPEVYRAKSGISGYTAQADIYSFGICLYQMMNNNLFPFEENEPTNIAIDRRLSGEPLMPPENAGAAFSRIILKACEFEPADRYADMDEMLSDLRKLEAGETEEISCVPAYSEPADMDVTEYAESPPEDDMLHADATVYAEPEEKAEVQEVPEKSKRRNSPFPKVIAAAALLVLAGGVIFKFAGSHDKAGESSSPSTVIAEAGSSFEGSMGEGCVFKGEYDLDGDGEKDLVEVYNRHVSDEFDEVFASKGIDFEYFYNDESGAIIADRYVDDELAFNSLGFAVLHDKISDTYKTCGYSICNIEENSLFYGWGNIFEMDNLRFSRNKVQSYDTSNTTYEMYELKGDENGDEKQVIKQLTESEVQEKFSSLELVYCTEGEEGWQKVLDWVNNK